MKTNDIVNILRERLPKLSDAFNSKQSISSLTATVGVATITLATANTVIQTGDKVLITGSLVNNPITSLSHVNGLATAITQNVHDLTEGYSTITISGATQSGYNGTFALVNVIDEKTFTFNVATATVSPATGSPVLMENTELDFNGYQTITKIDATHFTYPILNTGSLTSVGTPILNYNFRIHGTADIEKAIEAYTKQNEADYFLFVETGDLVSNKDRFNLVDSNYVYRNGQDYTQNCIQTLNFYFIVNCKNDMLATTFKDAMDDVRVLLFSSLLSLDLSNYLKTIKSWGITFKQDGKFLYNGAIYVHKFIFETILEITKDDIATPERGVAFRNITINYLKENGDAMKTDTIKLPK
jgi:hypothetical protein